MTAPARVAAALAVLALLLLGPVAGAGVGAARAMGQLPACRYDDILTSPRGYGDWSQTLVDTILRVTKSYVPPDLVPVTQAGLAGSKKTIRAIAIDDLRAMADAARAADAAIGIESAYRTYAEQATLYEEWRRTGSDDESSAPARPGHSEHQLGVAIDFKSAAPDARPGKERFASTQAGKWMAAHAWEFGWLMSYPEGVVDRTCYTGEPWHYRYVGREMAAQVHDSGLTLREYLWAHFTTTVVPLSASTPRPPRATASPALATVASLVPNRASPTLDPTPTLASPTLPPLPIPTAAPRAVLGASGAPGSPPPLGGQLALDAGQAVVAGALAILLGSILAVWLAVRGRPRGGPR